MSESAKGFTGFKTLKKRAPEGYSNNTYPLPALSWDTMKGLHKNCGLLRNKKIVSFNSITYLTVCEYVYVYVYVCEQ